MHKIKIKPLSVNDAWQGRRFKTKEYVKYGFDLGLILPRKGIVTIPDGKIEVLYRFGFSSNASDWDNPVKPLQDILSKRYGFNDKFIFKAIVEKEIVPKGCEFIEFHIRKYEK